MNCNRGLTDFGTIAMSEKEGVVGPSDGVKPREVLVSGYEDRE